VAVGEHPHHAGVIDGGQQSGLAAEAELRPFVQHPGRADTELQRDMTIQFGLGRQQHGAHATTAEHSFDPVGVDEIARHQPQGRQQRRQLGAVDGRARRGGRGVDRPDHRRQQVRQFRVRCEQFLRIAALGAKPQRQGERGPQAVGAEGGPIRGFHRGVSMPWHPKARIGSATARPRSGSATRSWRRGRCRPPLLAAGRLSPVLAGAHRQWARWSWAYCAKRIGGRPVTACTASVVRSL
jgi:hypothetical protein